MPKFRVEYTHNVKQTWEADVEAESAEEAVEAVKSGDYKCQEEDLTNEDGESVEDVVCLGRVEDGELVEEGDEDELEEDAEEDEQEEII